MMRTSDKGGIDYSIRDINHDWYLSSESPIGTDAEWVVDLDNASQLDTREDAESLAVCAGLAYDADDGSVVFKDGYEIVEVPWINEEDIPEDDIDKELDEILPLD